MDDAKTLARLWIETWQRGEPETLPLAEDFVHVSPFGRLEGRAHYLEVVVPLAKDNVAALEVRDVIGEGDQACVAFTMTTPNGPVACCDWIVAREGLIQSVHGYYDPRSLPRFETY